MFSEPQNVVIATVTNPLVRVDMGNRRGVFEDANGNRLTVSHTFGRRNRHIVRLDKELTAVDPLLDGVSRIYSMSAQLIIDVPPVGFTPATQAANVLGMLDWAKSGTNLLKVTSGES